VVVVRDQDARWDGARLHGREVYENCVVLRPDFSSR
jgi:hypothetical protein